MGLLNFFGKKGSAASVPEPEQKGQEGVRIYCASFEDLSPGYEDVYIPFMGFYLGDKKEEELVLARFIDGTDGQQTLEEACSDVKNFLNAMKEKGKQTEYIWLNADYLNQEEKEVLEQLEREIDTIALKRNK